MLVDFSTLVFTSSSEDEIRKFHVVVVQRGQINLHRRDSFVLLIQTYCLFCFLPFLPFLLPSSLFVKLPWLVKLYATAAKMRIIFWGIVSWTNQGYICNKFIHGKPTLVTICSQKPSLETWCLGCLKFWGSPETKVYWEGILNKLSFNCSPD